VLREEKKKGIENLRKQLNEELGSEKELDNFLRHLNVSGL
jgi:hypothetical protein